MDGWLDRFNITSIEGIIASSKTELKRSHWKALLYDMFWSSVASTAAAAVTAPGCRSILYIVSDVGWLASLLPDRQPHRQPLHCWRILYLDAVVRDKVPGRINIGSSQLNWKSFSVFFFSNIFHRYQHHHSRYVLLFYPSLISLAPRHIPPYAFQAPTFLSIFKVLVWIAKKWRKKVKRRPTTKATTTKRRSEGVIWALRAKLWYLRHIFAWFRFLEGRRRQK